MLWDEEPWLKERRGNIDKIKKRRKEYEIERNTINACEIAREKERRLLNFFLKIKKKLKIGVKK